MIKLYKSFLLSLVFILSFNTTSNARDVNLSMWTHNQLYVDYLILIWKQFRLNFQMIILLLIFK